MLTSEHDLQNAFVEYASSQGWITSVQVPYLRRCIDVVLVRPGKQRMIAVEVKLRDWRRAVDQAKVLKFASELVFVALPEERVTGSAISYARKHGVGILAVRTQDKTRVSVRLKPALTHRVSALAVESLISGIYYLKDRGDHGNQTD